MRGGSGVLADGDSVGPALKKRSDLSVRIASAAVMVTVAGLAFWLGGRVLAGFILIIGLGVLAEWMALVLRFEARAWARGLWLLAGAGYIGVAGYPALLSVSDPRVLLVVVGTVIAVDVGAYFAGRTFGGPKIAPAISPSKTWSGLGGGIVGAAAVIGITGQGVGAGWAVLLGMVTAIVAQSGDFFESWMKRRAGVKDSGRLIPGHGGLFDRADGLMAVLFVIGVVRLVSAMAG